MWNMEPHQSRTPSHGTNPKPTCPKYSDLSVCTELQLTETKKFWCASSEEVLSYSPRKIVGEANFMFGDSECIEECFGTMQVISTLFGHLDKFPPLEVPYRAAYRAATALLSNDKLPKNDVTEIVKEVMQMH